MSERLMQSAFYMFHSVTKKLKMELILYDFYSGGKEGLSFAQGYRGRAGNSNLSSNSKAVFPLSFLLLKLKMPGTLACS